MSCFVLIPCSNASFETLLDVLVPLLYGESDILFIVIVDSQFNSFRDSFASLTLFFI